MESAWKTTEHLVSFLEKVINPHARIRHNVFLPVIGRRKRRRQCDVVVWIGEPPREQFYIVEVQKRGKRPDINTFHGWVAKMRALGANGLICVSERGFPSSVVEEVAVVTGPVVKLMTLRPWDDPVKAWANLELSSEIRICGYNIEIIEASNLVFWDNESPNKITLALNKPVISHTGEIADGVRLVDAVNRCLRANEPFDQYSRDPAQYFLEANLVLHGNGYPLWLHSEEGLYKIRRWEIEVKVSRIDRMHDVSFSRWSYLQQGQDGVVAWAAAGEALVDGEPIVIELAVQPKSDGSIVPIYNVRGGDVWAIDFSVERCIEDDNTPIG